MRTLLEKHTKVGNKVNQLGVRFRFEVLRQPKHYFAKPQGMRGYSDYTCIIDSKVYCSDGDILERYHSFDFMTMRVLKNHPILFWEQRHCVDTLLHTIPPMKAFKNFKSSAARSACRKINDYLATLIASHQRVWIRRENLAAKFMLEAHKFAVVSDVMSS